MLLRLVEEWRKLRLWNSADKLPMRLLPTKHTGFGRFRSVACISMPVDCFESNIKAILNSRTSSSELKWSKIKGDDKARDAIQFFGNVVQLTLQRTMRADVLTWDMHDSRHHNVFRRDDAQNQQNMFRMLFRDVFAKRWGSSINYWNLSVDAQGLKSPELLGRHLDIFGDLSVEVLEADSQDVPFIQVADSLQRLEPTPGRRPTASTTGKGS